MYMLTNVFLFLNVMKDIRKRHLLFLFGCVPFRLCLVYLAKTLPHDKVRTMGLLAAVPTLGFLILYVTNSRLKGAETFGQPIWWHALRLHHFLLYLLFVVAAFTKPESAFVPLLVDVILGTAAFAVKHFT